MVDKQQTTEKQPMPAKEFFYQMVKLAKQGKWEIIKLAIRQRKKWFNERG